jgi:hypothetical protein
VKIWIGEGDESIIIQLTPETRDEDRELVRMGVRAKAFEGGKVEAYVEQENFFAQIVLPAVKQKHGIVLKRGK